MTTLDVNAKIAQEKALANMDKVLDERKKESAQAIEDAWKA